MWIFRKRRCTWRSWNHWFCTIWDIRLIFQLSELVPVLGSKSSKCSWIMSSLWHVKVCFSKNCLQVSFQEKKIGYWECFALVKAIALLYSPIRTTYSGRIRMIYEFLENRRNKKTEIIFAGWVRLVLMKKMHERNEQLTKVLVRGCTNIQQTFSFCQRIISKYHTLFLLFSNVINFAWDNLSQGLVIRLKKIFFETKNHATHKTKVK